MNGGTSFSRVGQSQCLRREEYMTILMDKLTTAGSLLVTVCAEIKSWPENRTR